jgi:predicted O-linked N-acetylglucosamine transferase (SPINDLY family)
MTAIYPTTIQPSAADDAYGRAMQLQIEGRLDLAEPMYRSILEAQPTHAGANHCLGMLLVQRRRPKDALSHLLAALHSQPEVADYWLGYLEALLLLGENAQAAEVLSLARQHGLGGPAVDDFALRLESKSPWGAAAETPALTTPPAAADGAAIQRQETAVMALVNQARFHEALPLAREMTKRFPDYGAGWKISGAMLWATGSEFEAIDAMQTSVRLLPRDAEAHKNLGAALNKLQRLDEAEHSLHRALQVDPNFAPAHLNLGHNYQMQGRYAEARSSLQAAIALQPEDAPAGLDSPRSLLLFVLNHDPSVDAQTLFTEHCRVGAYLERSGRGSPSKPSHDRHPDRCLQIGFVSADLRTHSVAYFIEPLLSAWQGSDNLRITVYYTNSVEDDTSRRLRGYVQRWRGVFGLSDDELAQQIADDGIDILIDLSGHTSLHRLGVFARKAAPLQASWLGYPGTTGLRAMDYYLADKYFLPPGKFERYFTEKLL